MGNRGFQGLMGALWGGGSLGGDFTYKTGGGLESVTGGLSPP